MAGYSETSLNISHTARRHQEEDSYVLVTEKSVNNLQAAGILLVVTLLRSFRVVSFVFDLPQ